MYFIRQFPDALPGFTVCRRPPGRLIRTGNYKNNSDILSAFTKAQDFLCRKRIESSGTSADECPVPFIICKGNFICQTRPNLRND